jgi:hypothetical protein
MSLWLIIFAVNSVFSAYSSDPEQGLGERARENLMRFENVRKGVV